MKKQLKIQLRSATTIQELFALPGGRTWWKRNGWQKELVFDPTPGSASMRTLNRYLLEQGIRP